MRFLPASTVRVLAVLGLALTTACSNTVSPEENGVPLASLSIKDSNLRGLDEQMYRVSQLAPNFGGIWLDAAAGGLVVSSTTGAKDTLVLNAVAQVFATDVLYSKYPIVRVDAATFPISALIDWRAMIRVRMTELGISSLDVDERANMVRATVEDGGRLDATLAAIRSLGVPTDAVQLSVGGEMEPIATLSDKRRPVESGLRVAFSTSGGDGYCTHGADVLVPGGKGFVTAGHCNSTGVLGNGLFSTIYQSSSGASNSVGTMTINPSPFSGGVCPAGRLCRYSDASIIKYSSVSYYSGKKIAVSSVIGTTAAGSTTIGSILTWGPSSNLFAGVEVMKTGKTSGTTSGAVSGTCIDMNLTTGSITLLCQDQVVAFADAGDSGAPVFWQFGADILHSGIVVARSVALGIYTLSPWQGITGDTGIFP